MGNGFVIILLMMYFIAMSFNLYNTAMKKVYQGIIRNGVITMSCFEEFLGIIGVCEVKCLPIFMFIKHNEYNVTKYKIKTLRRLLIIEPEYIFKYFEFVLRPDEVDKMVKYFKMQDEYDDWKLLKKI